MPNSNNDKSKIEWSGRIIAVQPRIRLSRSFDQRYHNYLGYVIHITGNYDSTQGEFMIAVGKGAHEKHQFRVGMKLSGQSVPVNDQRLETAGYYKTSKIIIENKINTPISKKPPIHGIAPALPIYRERGHRRLDLKTYTTNCTTCIWGCNMPVEIILDQ